ncbi:hypothetical protein BD413DRAFT_237396 [Trametes elegans]|nr:hypothetical protein BD413DRAFT_237396 [Trametes elegans]
MQSSSTAVHPDHVPPLWTAAGRHPSSAVGPCILRARNSGIRCVLCRRRLHVLADPLGRRPCACACCALAAAARLSLCGVDSKLRFLKHRLDAGSERARRNVERAHSAAEMRPCVSVRFCGDCGRCTSWVGFANASLYRPCCEQSVRSFGGGTNPVLVEGCTWRLA